VRQIAQLGRPVLREAARPVADPLDPALQPLIDDLLVTMDDADGVGIAAPQVHESLALFIVASRPNLRYPHAPAMEPLVMMNPEIVHASPEMETGWEGCLSVPGLRGPVPRSREVTVRWLDRHGAPHEETFSGFVARIVQHEYDHIRGLVFLDRVVSTRDLVTEKEYRRIEAR
jgi:peptide deformylase